MQQMLMDGFEEVSIVVGGEEGRAVIIIDGLSLAELGALRSQLPVAVGTSLRHDAVLRFEYIETERCDDCP